MTSKRSGTLGSGYDKKVTSHSSMTVRVYKGGSWKDVMAYCRPARRYGELSYCCHRFPLRMINAGSKQVI